MDESDLRPCTGRCAAVFPVRPVPRPRRRSLEALQTLHCPRLYAAKGELDLIGFDGDTLALIELSITQGKHETLIRTAHYFLRERHIKECPLRSDVVAIDNTPGQPPVVRLQKSALSPFVHRHSDR